MKTISTIIALILTTSILSGQSTEYPNTLFGRDKGATGWYIEFPNAYSGLFSKQVRTPGIGLGIVSDHRLAIGFRAQALTGNNGQLFFKDAYNGDGAYLEGGFAGLVLEPKITPDDPVHFTTPIFLGIGGASYTTSETFPEWKDGDLVFKRKVLDTDGFLVFEPGVQLEVNLFRFMRFSAGAGYRWVKGMNLSNVDAEVLNGPTFTTSLKFGKF